MGRLIDRMDAGRNLLWLDSVAYTAQLLAGGKPPWTDVAAALAWLRKGQGLLRSDVIGVPLAAVVQAWLDEHPVLRGALAAKQRVLAPLKTLLADEGLRAHLGELVRGLRAGFDDLPLVLQIPSPRWWPALAYGQAFGEAQSIEVSDDDADGAAVYIADFLRSFGEAGVDALLLEEAAASAPQSEEDVSLYQPVINIAQHYRWNIGLLLPEASGFMPSSLDYRVASGNDAHPRSVVLLSESFWQSGDAPAVALRYARVPVGLQPEAVLDRIAGLR